jgi:hypothetical protein
MCVQLFCREIFVLPKKSSERKNEGELNQENVQGMEINIFKFTHLKSFQLNLQKKICLVSRPWIRKISKKNYSSYSQWRFQVHCINNGIVEL